MFLVTFLKINSNNTVGKTKKKGRKEKWTKFEKCDASALLTTTNQRVHEPTK